MYFAIRRVDGNVGKAPEVGTDAFAMDTGNSSGTIPTYDSNFTVDFALQRKPAVTFGMDVIARLTTQRYLQTTDGGSEGTYTVYNMDSSVGWASDSGCDTAFMAWMWARGQGFDVVTYPGTGASHSYRHSLGSVPEMYWLKARSKTDAWVVYHKDLNSGGNPAAKALYLNTTEGETTNAGAFDSITPTATHFGIGFGNWTNGSGEKNIAMLFSSVTGISKVGSYTGSGSGNTQTITTGFQPRFVIIKDYTGGSNPWYVLDTTRGWGSGNDDILQLNDTAAAITGNDWGAPTATGFTVTGNGINLDSSSNKYIYYAHA